MYSTLIPTGHVRVRDGGGRCSERLAAPYPYIVHLSGDTTFSVVLRGINTLEEIGTVCTYLPPIMIQRAAFLFVVFEVSTGQKLLQSLPGILTILTALEHKSYTYP